MSWRIPPGWSQTGSSGLRFATIKPSTGGGPDVSITQLKGDAGGLLANINRWRKEVGLGPIAQDDLSEHWKEFAAGDISGTLVEIVGSGSNPLRSTIVRLPFKGDTWFFKMIGPASEIEKHRDAYVEFVNSVRLGDP